MTLAGMAGGALGITAGVLAFGGHPIWAGLMMTICFAWGIWRWRRYQQLQAERRAYQWQHTVVEAPLLVDEPPTIQSRPR